MSAFSALSSSVYVLKRAAVALIAALLSSNLHFSEERNGGHSRVWSRGRGGGSSDHLQGEEAAVKERWQPAMGEAVAEEGEAPLLW